jgi:hypothetical protein
MNDEEKHGVCVICAGRDATGIITLRSDKHPGRTYQFFIHATCLKDVAKPGFAGVEDL